MNSVKSFNLNGRKVWLGELINVYHTQELIVQEIKEEALTAWVYQIEQDDYFCDTQKKMLEMMRDTPQAVNLVDCVPIGDSLTILVTERVPKRSLVNIKAKKTFFSDDDLLQIAKAVTNLLVNIHDLGFICMSVNEDTVYFADDETYKISNLGLMLEASEMDSDVENQAFLKQYMTSYDVFRDYYPKNFEKNLVQSIDLYSLGVLLYYLAFSSKDIEHDEHGKLDLKLVQKTCGRSVEQVLRFCLDKEHEERTSRELQDSLKGHLNLNLTSTVISIESQNVESTILANIDLKTIKKESTPIKSFNQRPSFATQFSNFYIKMTSDTQGWLLSAIEENTKTADPKWERNIIKKTWKKPEKVHKFSNLLTKILKQNNRIDKSIVVFKTLLLLHSYLKKGPSQVFTSLETTRDSAVSTTEPSKELSKERKPVILDVLLRIHHHWRDIAKFERKNPIDKARSKVLSYFLYLYSLILVEKIKLGQSLSNILLGNFSIEPFFHKQDTRLLFSSSTLRSLLEYGHKCILALNVLAIPIELKQLQVQLLINLSDEIYQLVSTTTHLISAFKMISNHLKTENLNIRKIRNYITEIENAYESCLVRFTFTLNDLKESNEFRIFADVFPFTSLSTVDELKKIPFLSNSEGEPNVEEYLKNGHKIGLFELPQSYGNIIGIDDSKIGRNQNMAAARQIIREYRSNPLEGSSFEFRGDPRFDPNLADNQHENSRDYGHFDRPRRRFINQETQEKGQEQQQGLHHSQKYTVDKYQGRNGNTINSINHQRISHNDSQKFKKKRTTPSPRSRTQKRKDPFKDKRNPQTFASESKDVPTQSDKRFQNRIEIQAHNMEGYISEEDSKKLQEYFSPLGRKNKPKDNKEQPLSPREGPPKQMISDEEIDLYNPFNGNNLIQDQYNVLKYEFIKMNRKKDKSEKNPQKHLQDMYREANKSLSFDHCNVENDGLDYDQKDVYKDSEDGRKAGGFQKEGSNLKSVKQGTLKKTIKKQAPKKYVRNTGTQTKSNKDLLLLKDTKENGVQCPPGIEDQLDKSFNLKSFMQLELEKGIDEMVLSFSEIKTGKKIAGGSTCEVFKGRYRGLHVGRLCCKLERSKKSNSNFLGKQSPS